MATLQALRLRPMVVNSSSSPNSTAESAAGRHSSSSPLAQSVLLSKAPITTISTYRRGSQQQPSRLLHIPIAAAPGAILGVEPDLDEDYVPGSEFKTAGEDTEEEDFPYGKLDGAHTYHEGDDNLDFFEAWGQAIKEAGGPNDNPLQATISWLFLPAVFSGLAFGVQQEYLFLLTVLFIFAFIGVEMAKPSKPSNFEYDPNSPGPGYKP
ncbi:unnamed protein product [Calypogeia fissa]